MSNRPTRFDAQADTYDQRVGIANQDCQTIVRAVLSIAQAQAGDLLLELGAGTGMIGTWFALLPLRYVGLDLSHGMLTAFRQRRSVHGGMPRLLQADGNCAWPLADATVRVIFSSRALHLLELSHVVRESFRVAMPDRAVVIMGRVQRQDDSVSAMMQRALQRVLRQHGYQGREGGQHQRQLLTAYDQHGATVLEPVTVVRWTVTWTPWQSLDAWDAKPGLGGLDLSPGVKRAILEELSCWAKRTFGDLHREVTSEEAYVVQGVRLRTALPPSPGGGRSTLRRTIPS